MDGVAERHESPPDRVFKWVAAIAAACLVGFIAFVVVRGSPHTAPIGTAALKAAPPPVLKAGDMAPIFTLPDLRTGPPVSLSGFRGRPVIVNFFASWCQDCRAELGAVATLARRTLGRVAVVGVDTNESSVSTASFLLSRAGATYPVAVDANATVATKYLVQALPVSYLVDASGKVLGAAIGPQSVPSMERWLAGHGVRG